MLSFAHFSLEGINLKRVQFWHDMKYQGIETWKVATLHLEMKNMYWKLIANVPHYGSKPPKQFHPPVTFLHQVFFVGICSAE